MMSVPCIHTSVLSHVKKHFGFLHVLGKCSFDVVDYILRLFFRKQLHTEA